MAELDWDYLRDLAEKVAREISLKWLIVEIDDVMQEILLHALEEQKVIERYQDDEEMLRRIFWNAGRRYASKERAYLDLMDDQYYYTPEEVRGILRSFIYTEDEVAEMIGKKDDLTRCVITDNILSARLDASQALSKVNQEYQDAIMRQYVYGLPAKDKTDARRGQRAVDALALAMNRHIRTKGRN